MRPTIEIVKDPDICNGRARIYDTRITVSFLFSLKKAGWTNRAILKDYPQLTDDMLKIAFKYANDNKKEMYREIE